MQCLVAYSRNKTLTTYISLKKTVNKCRHVEMQKACNCWNHKVFSVYCVAKVSGLNGGVLNIFRMTYIIRWWDLPNKDFARQRRDPCMACICSLWPLGTDKWSFNTSVIDVTPSSCSDASPFNRWGQAAVVRQGGRPNFLQAHVAFTCKQFPPSDQAAHIQRQTSNYVRALSLCTGWRTD